MRRPSAMIAAAMLLATAAQAQPTREKIIIDTDIGDDIDDAFAPALALSSPEFDVLGFSAAFGDTATRARMPDRMLGETGHVNIPVAMGTPNANACLHSDDDAFLHFCVKRVTSVAVSKLATSSISGSERASKPERH